MLAVTTTSKYAELEELERFHERLGDHVVPPDPPIRRRSKSRFPTVFIFGHGAWHDFELDPSQRWVSTFERTMADPSLDPKTYYKFDGPIPGPILSRTSYPRLFLPPNAQGFNKEAVYIPGQNNIKLMHFERDIKAWLVHRGWDVLGMFNLTLQSVSIDGSHATMESNLVKAMMVFNWLAALDTI